MKVEPDNIMSAMMASIQNRRGQSGAFMGNDYKKYQWGVRIPHLMMEWLFGQNVIPMPLLMELAGPPGSCKSAFLQYLMRLFAECMMNAIMFETENKMSWTLLESFLKEYINRIVITRGPLTQEEWMNEILNALKLFRAAYSKSVNSWKEGDVLMSPLFIGLDSLGGAPSNDTIAGTDKAGTVGRSYPIEALKNSRYFVQMPIRMRDLPVVFVYTNHEQTRIVEQKGPFSVKGPRSSQGGNRPSFYCGYRLFFDKPTQQQRTDGVVTQTLGIEVTKSSYNDTGRKIALPMCWTNETDSETGDVVQTSWFDWESALARFLAPPNGTTPKFPKLEMNKILRVERHSETSFSCKELGLSKVKPVEIGKAIEADADLVDAMRPVLNIKKWREWDGRPLVSGVQIAEQLDIEDPDLDVSSEIDDGQKGDGET